MLPFLQVESTIAQEVMMGQVHIRVVLTNHREAVMTRLGQLDASRVHRYETEALIDTGAVRSAIPAAVAERLGLFRLRKTDAKYADGRVEEVDMTEAVTVEILGRETEMNPMILGEQILLGVMVLEGLDLMVDCTRNRLVPYQGTWDQPVFRV
jgi:clan AA aspartic protease